MIKKSLIILFCIILLSPLVFAQEYKIEVSTIKETFEAGENIAFIVTLYDSQNNPIEGEISVIIEDSEKRNKLEESINSKELISINLGEKANSGQWEITAKYKEITATGFFFIKKSEQVEVELEEDMLTITNIGNTKFTKEIMIGIGETTGMKNPQLDIDEKVSYRLIAPEGAYNIKVIVNEEIIFSMSNVPLTGKGLTGEAIGALDEAALKRSPLTGGIRPDEDSENLFSYLKNSTFVYIFVLVILGAMILVALERRYRKKLTGKK